MEQNDGNRWVEERMAVLRPEWQTDFVRGRNMLEERLAKPARGWAWKAVLAAGVCLTAVALPQTRALAQQVWNHLVLSRVEVVRVDLSDLPLRAEVTTGGAPQAVRDLDEAAQKAGFRPALPAAGVLTGNPSITVIGAIDAEQTIRVGELEAALGRRGARDVQVPAEWEGVQLRARIGPMVSLGYAGDVGILEAKPIEIAVPAGFPLQRFTEAAFRSIGVEAREAKAMAQRFVENPAWMMGIPSDEAANVETVVLRTGPALLIQDFNDDGSAGRVTVFRSTKERVYCVLTNDRQLALRAAEALP